jgi:hypothetical protein
MNFLFGFLYGYDRHIEPVLAMQEAKRAAVRFSYLRHQNWCELSPKLMIVSEKIQNCGPCCIEFRISSVD